MRTDNQTAPGAPQRFANRAAQRVTIAMSALYAAFGVLALIYGSPAEAPEPTVVQQAAAAIRGALDA